MILTGGGRDSDTRTTLDDLFRRAGVRRPEALALADPPNAADITGSPPRRLSYAEADRAISTLAARLRTLGLSTDAVVATQLANTVDSVIALLGILRAGMVAAPLPLLWRQQDIAAALARCGAKAIITTARIGASAPAEIAMQAAAEVFAIRHVCGFGAGLPDGVTPLDDCRIGGPAFQPSVRPGNPAAHLAVITFDISAGGLVAVARSHSELIAGGLAVLLEAGIREDAAILSTIPLGSFAGLALGLVPWLFCGGTLALHHGFDPDAFAAQSRGHDIVVLPAPALTPLGDAGLLAAAKTILALWRAPEQLAGAVSRTGATALIDVASFGEIGILPARRGTAGLPATIPHGAVNAPRGAPGGVTVAETARSQSGTLALRGPMLPAQACAPDETGFLDTGFACRVDAESNALVLGAAPAGVTAIGGYRLRQPEAEAMVAAADPTAVVVALPDALLGQRLAGNAPDRALTAAALQAAGVHALIAAAFRPRGARNAA